MNNKVSVVITSCGRLDLLERTIKSFKQFNTYPIEKYIVIDNANLLNTEKIISNFFEMSDNFRIIVNEVNIGQVQSVDNAYNEVETEYIFHSEDDWEFFDSGFIEKSLDVLNHNKKVANINLRKRFDGERGSMHPLDPEEYITDNGTIYRLYQIGYYHNLYHGFSWNPGLRRLSDYKLVGPYKPLLNEEGANKAYFEKGFRGACLEKSYCKHIGTHSVTPLSNS